MRIVGIASIVSALLLFGCSSGPQQQQAAQQQPAGKKPFVSVPELKDVMNAMIMEQADMLWAVTGPEDAPKDDDGWRKLDYAAITMIETTKFYMISHLAKDQGEWQKQGQALIDAVTQAREAIKARDADKLLEVGGAMEGACSGCHKLYYTEG
jgi:hypothetical protein